MQKTIVPIIVWLGFNPFRPVHNHLAQILSNIADPVFLLEKVSRKFCRDLDGEEVPNWDCLFVLRQQGLFLSVYVDDIKMAGRKQYMAPMRRTGWNWSILENLHHFLTTYTWDALNANASRTKSLLVSSEKCSNHEILLEQLKNCLGRRKTTQRLSRGHKIWKDMRNSALKDIMSWRSKRQSNCTKFPTPCLRSSLQGGGTGNGWESCPKYAPKLSQNAFISHESRHWEELTTREETTST